jgi:F0F1-type ATP synthase epsilon subunit
MEESLFQFEIISPSQSQIFVVEWIELESPSGTFFIGPGHAHLISIIKNQSVLLYKKPHLEPIKHIVSGGIFSVQNNKAFLLLDQ